MKQAIIIINAFFAQLKTIIGTPKFSTKQGKVIVQVPYFGPRISVANSYPASAVQELTNEKINALGLALSSAMKVKSVEVQLVRMRYPYLDSTILGKYLALNAGKYNFLRMKKMLFNKAPWCRPRISSANSYQASAVSERSKSILPSWATGVKLELAGRLTTQRSIPRKTVVNVQKGSFRTDQTSGVTMSNSKERVNLTTPNYHKVGSSLDFSQYASKNKLGAYTMKVWLSSRSKKS